MGGSGLTRGLLSGGSALGGLALTAAGAPEIGLPLMMGGIGSGIGQATSPNAPVTGMLEGGMAGAGAGAGLDAMGLPGLASMGSLGQSAANALSGAGVGGPGREIAGALASNPATSGMSLADIAPSELAVTPSAAGAGGSGLANVGIGLLGAGASALPKPAGQMLPNKPAAAPAPAPSPVTPAAANTVVPSVSPTNAMARLMPTYLQLQGVG